MFAAAKKGDRREAFERGADGGGWRAAKTPLSAIFVDEQYSYALSRVASGGGDHRVAGEDRS